MFIFSVMNEVKFVFSDNEMVMVLRELGAIVEERQVTKWMNGEAYQVWVWQVKKGDGNWTDAVPVFRGLMDIALKRSIAGQLSQFDLLMIIK